MASPQALESFNTHTHTHNPCISELFAPSLRVGNEWLLPESDFWCFSQVRKIRKVLREIDKPFGLYPNFLSPVSGNWVQREYPYSCPRPMGSYSGFLSLS